MYILNYYANVRTISILYTCIQYANGPYMSPPCHADYLTACYTRDIIQQAVLACSISLHQMKLHKFTKLVLSWPTVTSKPDVPAHDCASPYEVQLQMVKTLVHKISFDKA